jgi:beta-xylosidase
MKKCTVCKTPKDITEFDEKKKGKFSSYCKVCRREKIKDHYNKNKKYYKDKSAARNKMIIEKFKIFKETLSCTDCNMSFEGKSYLCDFHHLNSSTKEKEIAHLKFYKWSVIMKELSKCIPLCANCHRTRHNK